MKPLAIDLYCGLGGWTEGLLAEGWRVVGFDIDRHEYGEDKYPSQLVLQDVLTIHGSQFKDAHLIVASPPCQAYSYRAMPWSRAKALPPPDNSLFDSCFRIQREAREAAGRHIPLVVENVRGAQKWVGRAAWNFGSFYLWGDVPALMPIGRKFKSHGLNWSDRTRTGQDFTRVAGLQCDEGVKVTGFRFDGSGKSFQSASVEGVKSPGRNLSKGSEKKFGSHNMGSAENIAAELGLKQPGLSGTRANGKGGRWLQDGAAHRGSKTNARKAASARIAKIPFVLARYIASVYYPDGMEIPR